MSEQNVTGWERALSLAVGIAGVGNGFKRGGVSGFLEIAASLLAVKRGLTGHCAMKSSLARVSSHPTPTTSGPQRNMDNELGVPGGAYNVRPAQLNAPSESPLG